MPTPRTVTDLLRGLEPLTPVTIYTKSSRVVTGVIDDNHEADGITLVIAEPGSPLDECKRAYIRLSEIEGFDW